MVPALLSSGEAAVGLDAEPAHGAQRSRLDGGHAEVVPVLAHLRPVEAEDLDGDAELEGAQTVVGERHDEAVGRRLAARGGALA